MQAKHSESLSPETWSPLLRPNARYCQVGKPSEAAQGKLGGTSKRRASGLGDLRVLSLELSHV